MRPNVGKLVLNTKCTMNPLLWTLIRHGRTASLGMWRYEMIEQDHCFQVMVGVWANSSAPAISEYVESHHKLRKSTFWKFRELVFRSYWFLQHINIHLYVGGFFVFRFRSCSSWHAPCNTMTMMMKAVAPYSSQLLLHFLTHARTITSFSQHYQ